MGTFYTLLCKDISLWFTIKKPNEKNSDVDIAVEILDMMSDSEHKLLWYDNHTKWEDFLSKKIGMKVDLQLYEWDKTPSIKRYLKESSIVLFESII